MPTITKKELIERIADETDQHQVTVKETIQRFLDYMVDELSSGNRLELRDFGVFEPRKRKARMAQNPQTLEPIEVPEKLTVKFKVGRTLKETLSLNGKSKNHTNGQKHK